MNDLELKKNSDQWSNMKKANDMLRAYDAVTVEFITSFT